MTLPQRRAPLVLVVDDDEDVRNLLMAALEDHGYAVEEAGDGREALAKMAAGRPDLVLLDLAMPAMDGWEVLAHLRQTIHPPVVAILSTLADRERALREGAAVCVSKPLQPGEVIEACRRVFPG